MTASGADEQLPTGYDDHETIAAGVARGAHRDMVGGMWEELGRLQFEFLTGLGLKPEHRLLDLGCGCLRGGVHFVPYLEPGNYFGIDANQSFLDAGRHRELAPLGLSERVPAENLRCDSGFDIQALGQSFDMALALSLFTHLPAPHLRVCLERLAPCMKPGGRFCATFFLLPEGRPFGEPFAQNAEITSHPTKDPYHYRMEDIRNACLGLPWTARLAGGWEHPRNQRMVIFERDAAGLSPGESHHRAYVGPPERYDFMGATQFALLFHLGLREHHRVLDFGCGSLRLGRLLIPWLAPGCYFGLEPNRWLIREAVQQELGSGLLELKQPSFHHNAEFDCTVFGQSFDFIVAQSVLTHCGPDLCRRFLAQVAATLDEDGLAVFSYLRASDALAPLPTAGWHYPECVAHAEAFMLEMAREAGLAARPLPWFHPGAAWLAVARRPQALPVKEAMRHLGGITLREHDGGRAADLPAPLRRPNPLVRLADQAEAQDVARNIGLGSARLVEPTSGRLTAGQHGALRLEFTAGPATVGAGGRILFCFHHVCSWSPAQTQDPHAPGHVTASASNGAPLKLSAWGDSAFEAPDMLELFPWQHCIAVEVGAPGLYPGESVQVVYGAGPAQAQVQSFAARPYAFKVLVDPQRLGILLPAEQQPQLEIVGGPAVRLAAVTASDHEAGGGGSVLVRVEDALGNLAEGYAGEISLRPHELLLSSPVTRGIAPGQRPVVRFENLSLAPSALCRLQVCDTGGLVAQTNPFHIWPQGGCQAPTLWGELHGHSRMSDGYGTPEEYFRQAREVAGLDLAALTEHDFMLTDADWARVKAACNAANAPGEFVTLQGYEWSGPLEGGGDRNVYFRGEDPPICRSRPMYDYRNSHVYHGPERGANHVEDLFRWLDDTAGEGQALVVPHWGGRAASPRWTDPRYEKLVEIFSEHRESEDLAEAFRAGGGRFGVVAGGDDHICRPGSGFLHYAPGLQSARSEGQGLVAVRARRSREDVFQALAERRTYATTGARILLEFAVDGHGLGSIARCVGNPVVTALVFGTAHLDRLEVWRDGAIVHVQETATDPSSLRLDWTDAEYLALGRQCAYWLRVIQKDGHLAVSSPVWLAPQQGGMT